MARARRYRPGLAVLLLSAVLATGQPGATAGLAGEGSVTVERVGRALLVTDINGGKRALPGKTGIRKQDEGVVFAPRYLRTTTVLVVAEDDTRTSGLLERMSKSLESKGVIAVAPKFEDNQPEAADRALARLDTLLSWVQGQYKVVPGKLFVVGFSRGGELAYRLALAKPARFGGLILVSCWPPKLTEEDLAKAKDLPILLVHGEADRTCPVANAKAADEALSDAGLTVTVKKLPGADHDDALVKHAEAWLDWMVPPPVSDSATTRAADTLDACRELYNKGKYAAAAQAYRKFISDDSLRVSASLGLAEALAMVGKYDEATGALKAVEPAGAASPAWHVGLAELLYTVGKYDEALAHAAKADELKPAWAPAIFLRGWLLETLGRKSDAVAVYKSMSKVLEGDSYRGDARTLVALGRIMDRHAILTGQRASEQASNILHNYLQEAYLKVDEKYWPANVAAGMFLLTKHRPEAAEKEFSLANKINPEIPDVYVGLGAIQLGNWRFEQCMKAVEKALAINPKHADALLLKAICDMQWRKFPQVPPTIQKVLDVNPNHLDALSLMAAVYIRTGEKDKAGAFIERVKRVNAGYAGLPNTIGEWLAAARQFEEAEKYYRQAIELAPELAGPVTDLGKMYMQTGEEDKALETLKKAHEIDNFRADVVNTLNLLEKMKKYLVRETEHFIVKVDGQYDSVLLDQVAEHMEKIHRDVAGDFDHTPARKTIIEFFPTHSDFSIRITGRGWIGTVGACTGRVIALAAPNTERSAFGTHNWATVLRHEYTHAVTLAATNNRIPHWFTEACAVWEQPDKRNYGAVRMLVDATRNGRLFPIHELDWGFIRPKRAGDRSLAYAQAEWAMEYIIDAKGYDTIVKMLRAFRDGMTQGDVFGKIVGIKEGDFDKGFREWARQTVRKWGFPADPPPDLAQAAKEAKAKPTDAKAQATLAVAQYYRGHLGAAEKSARAALAIDPDNTRALAVLAVALAARKQHDEAIGNAEKLESLDHTTSFAPKVLAQCYIAKRRWAEAITALELLQQRQPLDQYSYEELAKIYTQLGKPDKALPNLIHLHRHTMRDPKYARQIAEIYRAKGLNEEALSYFEQITQINPYQPNAYEAMAAIYRNTRQYDLAVGAIEKVCMLEPDKADTWAKAAMMRYLAGKAANDADQLLKAKEAAEKALHLDSESPAKEILERIDAALEKLETKT